MNLISRLKEAREAFHNAYTGRIHDKRDPFPQELMDHMIILGVALLRTRNMGEPFQHSAQLVFNRYIGTASGVYDNEELPVRNTLTLSEGVSGAQLEECYNVLDAAVRELES